jgi:hypothetical protein
MNKTLAIAGSVLMAAASGAFALPIATVTSSGQTDGRPFNVVTTANGSFISFCLESQEYLWGWPNGSYFYEVSDAARYNNVNSLTTDPISKATAWLYRNFTTVGGYANNNTQNMLVQRAIWALEGEVGGVSAGNPYYLAATSGAQAGYQNIDANGAFGVKVLNLWTQDAPNNNWASRAQDLLVPVPDSGTTVAFLGLGVAAIGLARRRLVG